MPPTEMFKTFSFFCFIKKFTHPDEGLMFSHLKTKTLNKQKKQIIPWRPCFFHFCRFSNLVPVFLYIYIYVAKRKKTERKIHVNRWEKFITKY